MISLISFPLFSILLQFFFKIQGFYPDSKN